jgi:hypothetical protein
MEKTCREIFQFRQRAFNHGVVTGPQIRTHRSDAHDDVLKGVGRQIRWTDTFANPERAVFFPEAPDRFKCGREIAAQEFS